MQELPSQEGKDMLRYLVYEHGQREQRRKQWEEDLVDENRIRRKYSNITTPYQRRSKIQSEIGL